MEPGCTLGANEAWHELHAAAPSAFCVPQYGQIMVLSHLIEGLRLCGHKAGRALHVQVYPVFKLTAGFLQLDHKGSG